MKLASLHPFNSSSTPTTRYTRRQTIVLAVAITLKLAISLWNYYQFDLVNQYDNSTHMGRIGTCGVYTTDQFYNQPGYYLLSCPVMVYSLLGEIDVYDEVLGPLFQGTSLGTIVSNILEKVSLSSLAKELAGPFLQLINVVMIFLFYYIWAYKIFPHFLESGRSAFFASAFLLALPGYQRLVAMTHPDNLLVFSTTLALYFWLRATRERRVSKRDLIIMALLLGLVSLTRPFAIIPLACLSVAVLVRLWREQGSTQFADVLKAVVFRGFLFSALIVAIGASWWGYRYAMLSSPLSTPMDTGTYWRQFAGRAAEFDYVSYYTTFHAGPLLERPNRYLGNSTNTDATRKASLNNSFFTLLFSDFWGDHWLYFSGAKKITENKTEVKRALLTYSMVLTPFFLILFVVGLVRSTGDFWRRQDWEIWMAVVGIGLLGFLLFLFWQVTIGLSPGKNSSIKFIYFAYSVPFLVMVMFKAEPERYVPTWVIEAVLAGLFVLALPVATYSF